MNVEINKQPVEVDASLVSLGKLLKAEGLDGPGRAVAVDGSVVRRDSWSETPLHEGMKITVIRAVCGG